MSIFNLFRSNPVPEPEKAFLNLTRAEKLSILRTHGAVTLANVQRVDINKMLRDEGYQYDQGVANEILSKRLIAEIQSEIDKEKQANAEKEVQRLLDKRKKK